MVLALHMEESAFLLLTVHWLSLRIVMDRKAVSMETSIAHIKPLHTGRCDYRKSEELHVGRRTAHYKVDVTTENGELVALFKGTVFIKS